jgi:hypothetical protein
VSNSLNEWELMVAAEDIEPGNSIAVELEDGDSADMVFVGVEKGAVKLLNQEGQYFRYSMQSLEELDGGYSFITG